MAFRYYGHDIEITFLKRANAKWRAMISLRAIWQRLRRK